MTTSKNNGSRLHSSTRLVQYKLATIGTMVTTVVVTTTTKNNRYKTKIYSITCSTILLRRSKSRSCEAVKKMGRTRRNNTNQIYG